MRVGGLLPNCAAGKALCGADPRIPQGCPKTCGVCVDGETEVLEDLRCKPKQVQENLQAFILACDGVSTCDGACKEAFDAKYLGCVRGYVPVILEGASVTKSSGASSAPARRTTVKYLCRSIFTSSRRAPK